MRIGALARRTGVSIRSLRYYEGVGLLGSQRSASGQRHYTDSAVDRVILIQELFAAGLCSSKIARLLPCLDAEPSQRTPELLDDLLIQRQRLDDSVRDLQRARHTLDGIIDRIS